jgi:hypothetical protein
MRWTRILLLTLLIPCIAATWIQAQSYEAKLTDGNLVLVSVKPPSSAATPDWAVLLQPPSSRDEAKISGKNGPVKIFPLAKVQFFNKWKTVRLVIEEQASFTAGMALVVSVPLETLGKLFPNKQAPEYEKCRFYIKIQNNGKDAWIPLETNKAADILTGRVFWEAGVKVEVYQWPAGDPELGIGDGSG